MTAEHLRPRPITDVEYHDHLLVGLSVSERSAELLVESPDKRRTTITLVGIRRLLSYDFLSGNIIDIISCHRLSDAESVDFALRRFMASNSQYYSEACIAADRRSGALLGLTFIEVWPIYGAELLAIAESVSETSLP